MAGRKVDAQVFFGANTSQLKSALQGVLAAFQAINAEVKGLDDRLKALQKGGDQLGLGQLTKALQIREKQLKTLRDAAIAPERGRLAREGIDQTVLKAINLDRNRSSKTDPLKAFDAFLREQQNKANLVGKGQKARQNAAKKLLELADQRPELAQLETDFKRLKKNSGRRVLPPVVREGMETLGRDLDLFRSTLAEKVATTGKLTKADLKEYKRRVDEYAQAPALMKAEVTARVRREAKLKRDLARQAAEADRDAQAEREAQESALVATAKRRRKRADQTDAAVTDSNRRQDRAAETLAGVRARSQKKDDTADLRARQRADETARRLGESAGETIVAKGNQAALAEERRARSRKTPEEEAAAKVSRGARFARGRLAITGVETEDPKAALKVYQDQASAVLANNQKISKSNIDTLAQSIPKAKELAREYGSVNGEVTRAARSVERLAPDPGVRAAMADLDQRAAGVRRSIVDAVKKGNLNVAPQLAELKKLSEGYRQLAADAKLARTSQESHVATAASRGRRVALGRQLLDFGSGAEPATDPRTALKLFAEVRRNQLGAPDAFGDRVKPLTTTQKSTFARQILEADAYSKKVADLNRQLDNAASAVNRLGPTREVQERMEALRVTAAGVNQAIATKVQKGDLNIGAELNSLRALRTEHEQLAAAQKQSRKISKIAGDNPTERLRVTEAVAQRAKQIDERRTVEERAELQKRFRSVQAYWDNVYKVAREEIEKETRELKRATKERERLNAKRTPAAMREANDRTRARVDDFLTGDGGVGFGRRIATGYGLFMGVDALYNAVFGTLHVIKDLDKELHNLQGIAAATDLEMVGLASTILEVSSRSKFAATEIAQSATVLAQAGFSVTEIGQSLEAFTQLAAASGSTLAEAVDVGTAALGAYGLRAEEATHVADVMVASLNLTKLTMEKLALGIQYVGNTAAANNITLEESVAVMGAMAQAGIRSGSTLGTGFRQLLVDLQEPSKNTILVLKRLGLGLDDIDVKTHGFLGVMENLRKAGFSAADAVQAFETRAAAAFVAMRNQGPLIEQLNRQLLASGAAAKAAETQMDSLAAHGQQALNNLATVAVEASAPWTEALKQVLGALTDVLLAYNQLDGGVRKATGLTIGAVAVGGFSIVLGRMVSAFVESRRRQADFAANTAILAQQMTGTASKTSQAAQAVAGVGTAAAGAATKVGFFGKALAFLGGWPGLLITAFTVLLPLIGAFGDSSAAAAERTADLETRLNESKGKLDGYQQTLTAVQSELDKLTDQSVRLSKNKGDLGNEVTRLSYRFGELAGELATVGGSYEKLIGIIQRFAATRRKAIAEEASNQDVLAAASITESRTQNARIRRVYGGSTERQVSAVRQAASGRSVSVMAEERARQLLAGEHNLPPQALNAEFTRLLPELRKSPKGNALARDLQRYVRNEANILEQTESRRTLGIVRDQANLASTPQYIENEAFVRGIQRQVNSEEMTPQAAIGRLDKYIREIEDTSLPTARTDGQRQAVYDLRQAAVDLRAELLAKIQQGEEFAKAGEPKVPKDRPFTPRATDAELRAITAEGRLPSSATEFLARRAELEAAAERFRTAREREKADTLADRKAKGEDVSFFEQEFQLETESKVREAFARLSGAFDRALQEKIERDIAAIEEAGRQATFDQRRVVAGLEGQREALDRASLEGRVPDFTRRNLDFKIRQAEEQLAANEVKVIDATIAAITVRRDELNQAIAKLGPAGDDPSKKADLDNLITQLRDLNAQLDELGINRARAAAVSGPTDAVPKTFGEGFDAAAQDFARTNGMALSLKETLINGLGGGIDTVYGSLQRLLTALTGNFKDLRAAFVGLFADLFRYIQQLVVKWAALQIIKGLFSAFGAKFDLSTSAPTAKLGGGKVSKLDGGKISLAGGGLSRLHPFFQRFDGKGGKVRMGVSNRDSVDAELAEGEYVLRKRAVDDVGVEFLDDLNRHGGKALKRQKLSRYAGGPAGNPGGSMLKRLAGRPPAAALAGRAADAVGTGFMERLNMLGKSSLRGALPRMAQAKPSIANIYVVAPERVQSLGPNDVKLIIADDLLQGGVTMQLLKQLRM